MRIIRALSGRAARLRFRLELWEEMNEELGRRGRGERESGCFLLSPVAGDGRTVTAIAYLDDLDPASLVGMIHFHAPGYGRLWSLCERENLRVVGDVHTHGGDWVGQSPTDCENPMVSRVGHLALIVPHLAMGAVTPEEVGVHEYWGDAGWRSATGVEAGRLIYVGRWA